MPKDGEVHQCELLEYLGRYLYYVDGGEFRRWQFIVPRESTGTEDMDYLTYVLFCPCCGLDLRPDTGSGIAGRPQLQELLRSLKEVES